MSRRSLVLFYKLFDDTAITDHSCRFCRLLPRCSSMYSADTLPSWHGGHRCLLQSFFCYNSLLASPAEPLRRCHGCHRRLLQTPPRHLSVSCQHFAIRPVAGDTCRFFTRLPQTRQCLLQIRCNAPTRSSVSPADILLQQSSPAFPADLFKLTATALSNVSFRLFTLPGTTLPDVQYTVRTLLSCRGGPPCLLNSLNCCQVFPCRLCTSFSRT